MTAYKNTNRFNIYEPLFDPKRLFWIGMALKRKALEAFICAVVFICADEYNPTFYFFESYGSKNDCSRSIYLDGSIWKREKYDFECDC
jgi:hypothetical protein